MGGPRDARNATGPLGASRGLGWRRLGCTKKKSHWLIPGLLSGTCYVPGGVPGSEDAELNEQEAPHVGMVV